MISPDMRSTPPGSRGVPARVMATWSFGPVATGAAWACLAGGGVSLDAVVAGATAVEDDPAVDSVGVGGLPDASGRVSLDASVMLAPGRCGSVCCVREHPHAAALARAVMERTEHVMLAGEGADAFARREGFEARSLLTDRSAAAFAAWRAGVSDAEMARYRGCRPPMNVEERYARDRASAAGGPAGSAEPSHDTVCVLALDHAGTLAGACTTSGLAFKLPGRVGDSPIIGHGLYVDPAVGAATATGNGELIMGVCGSFLAVELMRGGVEPLEALTRVLERVAAAHALRPEHQVALVALRADGAWASASLRPGFSHAVRDAGGLVTGPAQRVLIPG